MPEESRPGEPGRWPRVAAAAIVATAVVSTGASQLALRADPNRYLAHVKFLASDDLAGRGNGTPGLERAADYIAGEFAKAGLEPGGDAGSYFQSFEVTTRLEPDPKSALTIAAGSVNTAFKLGLHFHPLSGVDARDTDPLALVFAGYGISAPGLGYDDYAGLDVTGAAVIVFTHEPQEGNENSVFEGTALTPYSDIAYKAGEARRHGARLLMIVEDPSHVADRALVPGWMNDPQIDAMGIPVVRVDRVRLSRALGLDFGRIADAIDAALKPQSRTVSPAVVRYADAFAAIRPRVRNVVGILRGSDPALAPEAIVIGAHYDHLGLGGRFSLAPASAAEIHNGADDNASGTAAVVEMARVAGAHRERFRRTVVFVTFAAEEIGLIGSGEYVRHAPVPIGRTRLMINLDMIGRARGRVMVGGAARPGWIKTLVDGVRPLTRLRLDGFAEGYEQGASDDASFLRHDVPVLAFFTGFHDDYHRPTDDWQAIDAGGAAEIASIALAIVERAGRN